MEYSKDRKVQENETRMGELEMELEHSDQETETLPNKGLSTLQEIPSEPAIVETEFDGSYDNILSDHGVAQVGQKREMSPSDGRRVRMKEEPPEESGKDTSGKPESELMMKPDDVHDPNNDSEYEEGIPSQLTEEDCEKTRGNIQIIDDCEFEAISPELTNLEETLDRAIHEYFEHGDTQKLILYQKEINPGNLPLDLVVLAVTVGIKYKAPHREMISVLLSDINEFETLGQSDIEHGFDKLLKSLPDLHRFIPAASTVLGKFIARAIADDCLPPSYVQTSKERVECVQVRRALEHADSLLISKHSTLKHLDKVWGIRGTQRPVKSVINQMVNILRCYLSSGDIAKARSCIEELDVFTYHHNLIFEAIRIVIADTRVSSMDLMCKLLQDLSFNAIVIDDQIERGFLLYEQWPGFESVDAEGRKKFQNLVVVCLKSKLLSCKSTKKFSSFSACDLIHASSTPTFPVIPRNLIVPPGEQNFTTEMENIINSALLKIEELETKKMCEMNGIVIIRKDLATLKMGKSLNDMILNFFLNLIVERSKLDNYPSAYTYSTFFYTKLQDSPHLNTLPKWTRSVDLFAYDIVFIPMHIRKHWALCVIDNRSKTIRYYDSFVDGLGVDFIRRVREFVKEEMKDKKNALMNDDEYQLEAVEDIPKQNNGNDCGMFVLKYAECISRDVPIAFEQAHLTYYRLRMVYEILTKQLL